MSSKHLIPRLLSGKNRLSRREKDVLFERVCAQLAPRRTFRRPAVLLALAGAAAAILALPWVIRDGRRPLDEPFGARGAAQADFGLVCAGQPDGRCQQGQKLLFDLHLDPRSSYRYFAAFARRDDGTVLWYFPDAPDGHSIELAGRLSHGVLDRGVALDERHGAGHYQVIGIYSAVPLTRDVIKARFRPGAADLGPDTSVVMRELVVP
jgi:hypothetical protein